ncbi:polyadenylate-binding protein-interacting protein 9-like [Cucurbita maxima]|uniref:Polyadenylate-binding protein-interacting protein 9-like n=1 Tax=Cucurbita maxima TaxID=3661 RepID=A0A6J1J3J1_CUCMA|nr:polyadenylate-binding protein-interacting protein 9-like [Cucurbita maxima]
MAVVAEDSSEVAAAKNFDPEMKPKSEFDALKLAEMFSNLNPLAKEFFPSSYSHHDRPDFQFYYHNYNRSSMKNFQPADQLLHNDNDRRRRNDNNNQGRRRMNNRSIRAQQEESVMRTVYVSDIDKDVSEEELAKVFREYCGYVNDCRICGDPHSVLRFAFVEFANEPSARAATGLSGTMVGSYPIKVLPSKTAILPVNPTFLPKSNDEWDMCTRTIYCTNIDKKVSQIEVKNFFETSCGEVTRLRLLGDQLHSTRIAFVEFAMAETALQALNCSGMILGTQPIRVSPSKTPVRPRVTRPGSIKPS